MRDEPVPVTMVQQSRLHGSRIRQRKASVLLQDLSTDL